MEKVYVIKKGQTLCKLLSHVKTSYDPSQGNSDKSLKYLWPVEARVVQKYFGRMLNPN